MELLRAEGDRLVRAATRRDLSIANPTIRFRRMHTIGTTKLTSLTSLIPLIYFDPDLGEFLSGIAEEDLLIVPDENERYVVNALLHEGDRHGAHIDDYAFALNIITECPSRRAVASLTWPRTRPSSTSKQRLQPEVHSSPGDVCFLRRTHPFTRFCRSLEGPTNCAIVRRFDIPRLKGNSSALPSDRQNLVNGCVRPQKAHVARVKSDLQAGAVA